MADVKNVINPQVQAGLIVIAVFCYKIAEYVLKYLFDKFWKKTVETDYVTVEQFKKHEKKIDNDFKEFQKNIEDEMHKCIEANNQILQNVHNGVEAIKEFLVVHILDTDSISKEEKKEAVLKLTSNKGGS